MLLLQRDSVSLVTTVCPVSTSRTLWYPVGHSALQTPSTQLSGPHARLATSAQVAALDLQAVQPVVIRASLRRRGACHVRLVTTVLPTQLTSRCLSVRLGTTARMAPSMSHSTHAQRALSTTIQAWLMWVGAIYIYFLTCLGRGSFYALAFLVALRRWIGSVAL